jgi:acylphosphatase
LARVRAHLYVSGSVQGVFYRSTAKKTADRLGVTGWIRNLPDGRVEVVLEGDEHKTVKMIEWCHEGPVGAEVYSVDVRWEPVKGEFSEFKIVYS